MTLLNKPNWLISKAVIYSNHKQINEHGGIGIGHKKDLLLSALGRPENIFHYQPESKIYELAAAYVFGIIKNHPFLDGNKRTSWVACRAFLRQNGIMIKPSIDEIEDKILKLATDKITQSEFAVWLESHKV